MTAAKQLLFYYDYSSPFAYLGSTQVQRIAEAHDAELVYRPFLLGALFQAIGTPRVPVATYPEAKRRWVTADLERWAKKWGVGYRFPSGFPLRTVDALRLTLLAPEPALVDAIFRRLWVLDQPPTSDTLRSACEDAGVDPGLVERTSDPKVKARLRAATDEAVARGICGAPTCVVDGELFWGQDRLHFVEQALSSS